MLKQEVFGSCNSEVEKKMGSLLLKQKAFGSCNSEVDEKNRFSGVKTGSFLAPVTAKMRKR